MGRLSRRFSVVLCLVFFLSVAWRPSDATNDLSRHPQQSSNKGGGRGLSSISKLDQRRSLDSDTHESSSKLENHKSNSRDLLTVSNRVWKITDEVLIEYNNDIQKIIVKTSPGDTLQFQVTKMVQPLNTMIINHTLHFTSGSKAHPSITTFVCPEHGPFMVITSPSFTMNGFHIRDCTKLLPIIFVNSTNCSKVNETSPVVELDNVIFTNITMKDNQRIFDASPPSCSEVVFKNVDFIDNSCMAVGCVAFPLVSSVDGSTLTRNLDNNLRWDDTAVYKVPIGGEATFTKIDASHNNIRIIYVSPNARTIVTSSRFHNNSGMGVINGLASVISIDGCTFTKNSMSGRYGVSWITGSGGITVSNSMYSDNRGEQGACVMVNNRSSGSIEGCDFYDNIAGGNGGVLQVTEDSKAVVTASNFYRNSAQYGGGAYLDYNSTIDFESCKFENNNVAAFGAAISAYRGATLRIVDSDISGSRGGHGGALRLERWITAFIESCTFTNNSAIGDGGAINMWIEINTTITDSTFKDNVALNGAGVFAAGDSVLNVDNTLFANNSCTDRGAAIFIASEHSSAQVTSTNFTDNMGNTCGAVRVQNTAFGNFTDCNFYENAATRDAGAISAHKEGTVIVCKTKFIDNAASKGGAISVTGDSSMKISDSLVANNTATKIGGAFRVDEDSSFEACKTKFIFNEAKQGGCGRIEGKSSAKASSCEFFAHSSTKEGGLMMVSGSNLILIDSSIRNSTSGSSGGAIHLSSSIAVANSSSFEYSDAKVDGGAFFVGGESNATISDSFINNSDAEDGGGIFAKDKSFTEVRNTVFTNNTASKLGGAVCSLRSWLLVEEIEVVGSRGLYPGPTITVVGGEFLIDGDSFGFV